MRDSPQISFVVPCYNYGRYLPDCLKSIFSQEGNYNFEIVAVDDGSDDNTQGVLRSFRDQRLTIIQHKTNLGHVVTINEGLNAARGKLIARIDPDDRYRSNFLPVVVPILEKYSEVGFVYGDAALINEFGLITQSSSNRIHHGQDFKGNEFINLLKQNFICAPTTIARREAWQKALPIPERYAFSDWYLSLQMSRYYDFYYVNQVIADYRVHDMNHHKKVVLDKTEEETIFKFLERVFSEKEVSRRLEAEKQKVRREIYAAHYALTAEKYFGYQMNSDAKRCYLQALQFSPREFLAVNILRHFMATLLGRKNYESFKLLILRPFMKSQ